MESKRFGDIEYKASGGKLHWVRDMMCNTRVVMDDDEFIALALCNPAVKALADAARALVNDLPNVLMDEWADSIGNTNAAVIKRKRDALRAALDGKSYD